MSVAATLVVKSLTASLSEYGEARPGQRDDVADVHRAAARGFQRHDPRTEERAGPDVCGGLFAEANVARDDE